MQITFEHEEGTAVYPHILNAKSPAGVSISVWFAGMDASLIYINGVEYEVCEDSYKGVAVDFSSALEINWLPVSFVIAQANAQIEDIVREINAEHAVAARHAKSFSQASL